MYLSHVSLRYKKGLNMSSISINKDVYLHLDNDERENLENTYKILKELHHELFIRDDDSDEYWTVDGTLMGLKDILEYAGVFLK